MKRKSRSSVAPILGLAICLGTIAPRAVAQQPAAADGARWSLGLGVISSPRPYVGAENQTRVIPVLDLEYKRFYFRGIQAGFTLVDMSDFRLDVFGRGQFGGYDEGDSAFLAGMTERRETVEVGLSATWSLGDFDLEALAAADALDRSGATQAGLELTWSKIFGRGKAGLFPSVGLVWQSSDFVDYYAGVRPEEARPARPAFTGRSAVNLGAGLRGFHRVTDRVRIVGLVRGERLAGELEDSPIVDSRWGYFGLLAIAYEL